jgi:hypothetical protein
MQQQSVKAFAGNLPKFAEIPLRLTAVDRGYGFFFDANRSLSKFHAHSVSPCQ